MPLLKFKFLSLIFAISLIGTACLFMLSEVKAEEYKSHTPRFNLPSSTLTGITGLNVIPNSRMDQMGTMRIGVSTSDPYVFTFLGFQVVEPLYVNIRQTSEVSSLNDSANRLYPGLDFKLRLIKEAAKRPELSIGANSAFGHQRTASEYLVLSKRKGSFDFTGGMAWGRLAGKGHIKNPLRAVSSHFNQSRNYNAEGAQNIDNWLTGKEIGFFGGIEYFTPLKGLSLKGEYGGYDYKPETTTNAGFNKPQPWSFGLNYKPWNYIDISIAAIGAEKIMAHLSIQDQIQKWPGRLSNNIDPPTLIYPRQNHAGSHEVTLNLNTYQSTGQQIGHQARLTANQTNIDNESIEISLNHKGLKGPNIQLIRHDIEKAVLYNQSSAEEIWHDINFLPNKTQTFHFKDVDLKNLTYRLILDNKVSLAEKDTGILYRSSAIIELEKTLPFGFRLGASPKVNIADNIGNIQSYRIPSSKPVRSNEDEFASNRFSIDQLYASWLHSLSQSTHINLSVGYLEEMFGGFGGEILYRPFGKTFAIGAEAWQVKKRDGNSSLAMQTTEQDRFTGYLNLFYELPNKSTTLFTKVGQYLAEDFGGTFGIKNNFQNGKTLEGFITATNQRDKDIFGGDNYLYGGVKFTLPFGNVPFVPKGSEARFTTAAFARDAGQTLNIPNKLYDVTEPISYRQLSRSWPDLLR